MTELLKKANDVKVSLTEAISVRNVTLVSNLALSLSILVFAFKFATFEPGAVAIPNAPLTDPIEVRGSWANSSFKQGHAIAFAELIGNISKTNIKFVKQRFLASSTPHLRDQFEEEIERQVSIISARKLKQKFTIEDIYFDEYQDVVWVWGNREITIPNQKPLNKIWTYEFRIGVHGGMPKISYFKQYPGKPNTRQRTVPASDTIPELTEEMRLGLEESGSTIKEINDAN
ncbi:TraE/TraK family type IV conjugative transfer system protein [Shewanella sp. UCD-KL12]|uniref:TraE/TraK family type IV conjugative transfer system protein n=1 Tax=Shewanella sp. UCD-KL12 TaxID=1917163 RepID=UPI0009706731|nr:TraE/TraK family type IV conjugative transfer system protein [Shewanella sp. UCD-KL12]